MCKAFDPANQKYKIYSFFYNAEKGSTLLKLYQKAAKKRKAPGYPGAIQLMD